MMDPSARFDDAVTGRSIELVGFSARLEATGAGDVPDVLEAAARAAADGHWVAGFVSYEAAPALDAVLPVRSRAGNGHLADLPLAWFGLFDSARPVLSLPQDSPSSLPSWRLMTTEADHLLAVEQIRYAEADGDCYQVNYTVRLEADRVPDPVTLYAHMSRGQRSPYACLISTGEHAVLSASPELFFEWDGERVVMRPMKGTAARGRWTSEDNSQYLSLANSAKDHAENVMIVDLIRNDLGRISEVGSVSVDQLFEMERYPTVWQLTSTISARTLPSASLTDLFTDLFPSGSVTGAPKRAAMQLIASVEDRPRGVYCGAVGLLTPKGSDSYTARFSVGIRTATVDLATGRAEYGAGGGITWLSNARDEWRELQDKTRIITSSAFPTQLVETTRSGLDGEIELLSGHLQRLARSAIHLGFPLDIQSASALLSETAASQPNMIVRLTADCHGELGVTIRRLPPSLGRPTLVAVDDDPVDPEDLWLYHKTTDRSRYERRRRRHAGVDDVIMTNTAGEITESTIANVAVLLDGSWITPPLRCGLLPGVARDHYLTLGVLQEKAVTVEDLKRADGVALLNAVRGWQSVAVV